MRALFPSWLLLSAYQSSRSRFNYSLRQFGIAASRCSLYIEVADRYWLIGHIFRRISLLAIFGLTIRQPPTFRVDGRSAIHRAARFQTHHVSSIGAEMPISCRVTDDGHFTAEAIEYLHRFSLFQLVISLRLRLPFFIILKFGRIFLYTCLILRHTYFRHLADFRWRYMQVLS